MIWIFILIIAIVAVLISKMSSNYKRNEMIKSSKDDLVDYEVQNIYLRDEIANLSVLLESGNVTEFDKAMAKAQSRHSEMGKKLNIASKKLEDADNIGK